MAFAPGCGLGSLRDKREDRDPLLRRAREKNTAKDIEGAVELYKRVIDKRPTLARAHLELALIYDNQFEDYVRAIYHYERYLELRPEAPEREHVRSLINHALIYFAASLPEQPNESVRMIRMLREENAALRAQVTALSQAPSSTAPSSPSRALPTAPSPQPAPAAAPVVAPVASRPSPAPPAPTVSAANAGTYVVQPGDTLSRIAGRVYGDSKRWQPIYDANRSSLPGGPQSVRVGQTLIIPKQD